MVFAPENRQISDVRNRGGTMKVQPGSVVIVLTSLVWCLVVRIAGFFLEIALTPSLASQLPQGLRRSCGSQPAGDAFNA
jgi:hypothetical protein